MSKGKYKKEILDIGIGKDAYNTIRRLLWNKLTGLSKRRIGGVGKTVEIDETYITKRKYNKGRNVRKIWVVGGICREDKSVFFHVSKKRNAKRLEDIIYRNVRKGTSIITDHCSCYDNLSRLGFFHKRVNHSQNFVDPMNHETHTQNI
ncbi:hypothetical protein DMUE_3263 [Dictyocoela muelleri]|nr:hypothetical protein DMUE_3263 [Dictyocoela muelleri]